MNSIPIEKVMETKYLGLHIDENLNWAEHISKMCCELTKVVGILFKVKNKMPRSTIESYTLIFFKVRSLGTSVGKFKENVQETTLGSTK